ncbi:TIGR04255 family protein [Kribbella sp. CA-247076]|uniref:TIGR04255 family protein n=1 Tax=Kribbella sp. CA-247076 TaxID=3239941 RepID=UPI003D8E7542
MEEDVLELEQPAPFALDRPPLVQALTQVQFPQIARLSTLAGVADIQDALLDSFPYMQQVDVQELQVAFGPGGVNPQATANKVTHFKTDDGWSFELSAGAAALTATPSAYKSARTFAERLRQGLVALSTVPGLSRCTRLGVRYVNIAPVFASSTEWTDWFKPELLGWARPGLLAPDTELAAMITETRTNSRMGGSLAWASKIEGVIRHGYAPKGSVLPLSQPQPLDETSFILDLDLFVTEHQPWDAEVLVEQYIALHSQIETFFYWTLTDKGKEVFGYREESNG